MTLLVRDFPSILHTQYFILPMRTLFLNLAGHSDQPGEGACIACNEDDRTVSLRFIDHRIDDAALLPELETVLREAGWKMEDMERIACVTGPGGFTSLRMAVTLANVLADQLRIPLAGVHGSDVYRARSSGELRVVSDETQDSRLKTQDQSFLWLHSTRKTHLFVRGFGSFAPLWPKPVFLTVEQFSEKVLPLPPVEEGGRGDGGIPWAGELISEHEEAVTNAGGRKMPLLPLFDALPSLLTGLTFKRQILEPWYGRGW